MSGLLAPLFGFPKLTRRECLAKQELDAKPNFKKKIEKRQLLPVKNRTKEREGDVKMEDVHPVCVCAWDIITLRY